MLKKMPPTEPVGNFVSRRQGGKLTIIRELAEVDPDSILAIFQHFIPVDARIELGDRVEYTGYSPHFRPLMLGERIPRYRAILTRPEHGEGPIAVKFELDPLEPRV